MRVAVIGPTNIIRAGGAAGLEPRVYTDAAVAVGRLLAAAGAGLIVVPDRGVAAEIPAQVIDLSDLANWLGLAAQHAEPTPREPAP